MVNEKPMVNKRPKWLIKLERESWQAELLISGIAIFGTLQLPDLVNQLIDLGIANIHPDYYFFLSLFSMLLNFVSYGLIFAFVFHFVLRTFWIGLIGVNSVFPNGINENSTLYSGNFLREAKNDFPDQHQLIKKIDEISSIIFAMSAQYIMLFIAITIDFVLTAFIYFLLITFLGKESANLIGKIILALLIILSLLSSLLLSSKSVNKKPWAKKIQYPLFRIMNKISLHIFYKPITYLMLTFNSNFNFRKYLGGLMLVIFLISFGVAASSDNSNRDYLISDDLEARRLDRSDRIFSENYLDTRVRSNGRILHPVLPSEVVSEPFLEVFVPILYYEISIMDSLCGEKNIVEGLDNVPEKKYYLDCYYQFHRYYNGDSLINQVDMMKYDHPNQGEMGILVKIPSKNFKLGRNILTIEKSGSKPNSTSRTFRIPFYLVENN